MSKYFNSGLVLIATLSGIGIGMLLAPGNGRQNRRWIAEQGSDLADRLEELGREAGYTGEQRINHLRHTIRKRFRDTVPDLYHATEEIPLGGAEFFDL